MAKILLLNQGNTYNYGDVAIKDTIVCFFENQKNKVLFSSFWDEKEVYGNIMKFKLIYKIINHSLILTDFFNFLHIKKTVKNNDFDCVVIGGGELLCGHSGFNSSLYIWTKIMKKINKPIYILGVSGDLKMSKKKLKRNRYSLSNCNELLVRDNYTKEICDNYYKVTSNQYPDVVFSYNKVKGVSEGVYDKDNTMLFVPIELNDRVKKGLNINTEQEYLQYCLSLISEHSVGSEKIIITTTTKDDINISNKIYNYLKENSKLSVELIGYSNLENYVKLVRKSNTIISGRMHAMILGLLYNNKVIAIPFKEKLIGFKNEYGNLNNINNVENNSFKSLEYLNDKIKKEIFDE